MFKVPDNNEIKTTVTIYELTDDDKVKTHECKARFVRLQVSDFRSLASRVLDDEDDYGWVDALKEHTKDFSPLPEGITFDEYIDQLLEYKPSFDGLLEAFTALNAGERELLRRKNSKKRAAGG